MPLNFDLAGKRYPAATTTITSEQIAAYADASGDPHPQHQPGEGQVASAIFPVVPAFALLGAATMDPELGIDNPLMIVHGEQRFRYHRPIRPGDELTLQPVLESVNDKGKHATFVTRVDMTDAAGDLVNEQWATILVRGGGSGASRAKDESAKASEPPSGQQFTQTVPVDMPQRYAAASGDHNPIHLDDAVAQAVGLPGVINHGLGTLSLVTGGLVAELCGGDVTRLEELACRFTAMVSPGDELTTTVTAGGDGAFRFETATDDGVVVTGTLRVRGEA